LCIISASKFGILASHIFGAFLTLVSILQSQLVQTLSHAVRESRLSVSDLIEFFPKHDSSSSNGSDTANGDVTTESAPKRRKLHETSLDSVLHFVELILLGLQILTQTGACERSMIAEQIAALVDRILMLLHSTIADLFPSLESDMMDVDSTDPMQCAS
jgi:hypothetical protein